MEKENSFILMVICTMDNGRMIKPTDMVFINIKMERNTRATGEMIYSTEWASKIGQIIHPIKECILPVKNMEKELINGVMGVNTLVTGKIIK